MSEKDQYHTPISNQRGTELQPGDNVRFMAGNPNLESINVVRLKREAQSVAQPAGEYVAPGQERIVTPRDAIAERTARLSAIRREETGATLDIEHDEPDVAFIDAMHKERAQKLPEEAA